jgi:hypothetical protein
MIFSSELDIRKTRSRPIPVQSSSVLTIASADTLSSRKLQTDVSSSSGPSALAPEAPQPLRLIVHQTDVY